MPSSQRPPRIQHNTATPFCRSRKTDGGYIALVGWDDLIQSSNGYDWAGPYAVDSGATLTGVSVGNGRIVVSSSQGRVYHSTNAAAWTPNTLTGSVFVNDTAYGNGRFVAVGNVGYRGSAADPTGSWAAIVTGYDSFSTVSYGTFLGAPFFAAVSSTAYTASSTGTDWSTQSLAGEQLRAVAFANDTFIAVGDQSKILRSTDGLTWSRPTGWSGFGTTQFNGVVRGTPDGGPVWVAVGYVDSATSQIVRSTDNGETWDSGVGPDAGVYAVAFGGGRFVAVGANRYVYTSTDGVTWTAPSGPPPWSFFYSFYSVTYGVMTWAPGGVFVAAGGLGTLYSAADPTGTWVARTSGTGQNLFGSAASASDLIVVGGAGTVLRSLDGTSWWAYDAGAATLYSVGYGAGVFAATGNSGAVVTSPDGVNWTVRPPGTYETQKGVAFGASRFVTVGDFGSSVTCP